LDFIDCGWSTEYKCFYHKIIYGLYVPYPLVYIGV